MTAFLFLQKFDAGVPVSMAFQPLMDILCRYGALGRGRGDLEVTLPPDTMAAGCTVIGSRESGVTCVGFDRPRFDDDLRRAVWECMESFGCAVFDDTLDTVCTTLDAISALPANLLAACASGARQIRSAQQLWPAEFEIGIQGSSFPALIYKNANAGGPNFQFFDYAVFDKKELYIELRILPEACNVSTLRVLRNLELRVDAALSANPEYCILYSYAHPELPLLVMESARLGELARRAIIISPPPALLGGTAPKKPFIADRDVFSSTLNQAAKLTQNAHEKYQLALDGSIASIDTLAQLLDKLHLSYRQERSAQPAGQPYTSKAATNWAIIAGGYLGTVIRQQIGAQWGYVTRGQYRLLAVRTHRGPICRPHLLVLDHVINGTRSSIAEYFRQLIRSGASATSRSEDIVCNIPGFCQILLGRSQFTSGGGLPLETQIPRDKLDFTVNSLRHLDLYLAEVGRQSATFSDLTLSNLMLVAGAYLGEVIRSNATNKGCWQWVTYDDYVSEQPDFAQKRPREPGFLAFLDSDQHMVYPFAQIAAVLGGRDAAPIHAYTRHLVCMTRGELAGTMLDSIDVQQCIRSLPADQRTYPNVTAPFWLESDPFVRLFGNFATLLEHGRLVWAHMVQANEGILDTGDAGLPGDIVYDPQGILSSEELAPIAATLFGLRKREDEFDPNLSEQSEFLAIAKHLNAETTRAFGMSVPRQLSAEPLLLSSVFFERKHLPGEMLILPYFPVLISDRCPGCAMLLPGRWWPQVLLDRVKKKQDEKQIAVWEAAWRKLAAGRTAEEEEYFQFRIKALDKYARHGGDGQNAVDLTQIRAVPFHAYTEPPPFEWEWDLVEELQSYGEGLLEEVETDRARGLPLNVPRTRQSFVVNYLAQMIALHRLLLCSERRISNNETLRIDPYVIKYAALGLAAGVEDAALKLARLLCLAWQRQEGVYWRGTNTEERAIYTLFAAHLGVQMPALESSDSPKPHLDALTQNGRWRAANGDELRTLLEAACEEYVRSALRPFEGVPAAILLVLKLREMSGLVNPPLIHPLFASPLALPGTVSIDAACNDLLVRVRDRMNRNGFREDAIEQAMVTQSPLVIHSRVGAMPLRPDLYQPSLFRSVNHQGKNAQPLSSEEAQRVDRLVNGTAVVLGFLPRVLTWLMLVYGTKAMLAEFSHVAGLLSPASRVLYTVWIVIPFVFLGLVSLMYRRNTIRDSAVLSAVVMLALFGIGVYDSSVRQSPELQDAKAFGWVPLVQLIWAGILIYLLNSPSVRRWWG